MTTASGESSQIDGRHRGSGMPSTRARARSTSSTFRPTISAIGAAQSGTVVVRVQGLINTTGVTNPLYKGIN